MKVNVSTLAQALAFRLDELLEAEIQLKDAIPHCIAKVSSDSLKLELKAYAESCSDKKQKLDQVYNHLMTEPKESKSKVIDRLIKNTQDMLKSSLTDEMRDVLLISCLQTINHYKIAGYKTALTFACELELETAADLLEQALHLEQGTEHRLSSIAINEVNSKIF